MRGNWEGAAETFVLAPSQQQQQQNMMETHQRHHPYQLPATPGWGMPHKLVKTEPMEENNTNLSSENYAGTSCSPGSRRSSGTGSLSPGSATSQDSNAMTSVNFDYSTQRLFTNQQSPLQFPRINMSDQTTAKNDHEPMDLGVHRSSEERDVEQDDFSCRTPPPFPSTNTMQNEDNYLSVKCDSQNNYSSELLEKSHDQLSPQLSPMDSRQLTSSPERSEHEYDNQKLLSSNISSSPRKNSHGKTKGYRCKECNFSTTTKQSLWKHAATHLKPKEKQLQCPYCPFITRYKHHFDYHISSHTGVKPYKCKECDYSCVNKSMLTSHAKSHLDIHQYRCADCSYETKYCHTLKKHLQKQGHKPQVVLNPDGTPNLSIIIDVHSTRRGPKQKPITKKIDAVKIDDNESPVFTATGPSPPPPTTTTTTTTTLAPTTQLNSALPPPQLSPASYYPGVNPMAMINAFGNQLNPLMALQLNQCFSSGFPIANNFPMINDEFAEKQIENLKNNILFSEYAKTVASGFDNNQQKIETMVKENNNELVSDKSGKGPLDLSKLEDFSGSNDNNEDGVNQGFNNLADNFIGNQTTGINQFDKPSGTRKRKGKAVKLNVNNHSGVEEVDNQIAPTSTTISSTSSSSSASSSAASTPESKDKNEDNNKIEPVENEFKCKFCEISFGNEIMYSIHMGYHGFNDPYTCNSCGIKCDDKVSFYLHIHRSKHT